MSEAVPTLQKVNARPPRTQSENDVYCYLVAVDELQVQKLGAKSGHELDDVRAT